MAGQTLVDAGVKGSRQALDFAGSFRIPRRKIFLLLLLFPDADFL